MDRFSSVDDGIDFRAQTAATLASCIQNRQWQHVARIGGFKSEHDARVAYDSSYNASFAPPAALVAIPKLVAPYRRPRCHPRAVGCSSNAGEPWVIAFLQQAKSRMSILGIERKHIADHIGIARSTLGSCFAPRTGYLSERMMARIDAALTEMEAGREAA